MLAGVGALRLNAGAGPLSAANPGGTAYWEAPGAVSPSKPRRRGLLLYVPADVAITLGFFEPSLNGTQAGGGVSVRCCGRTIRKPGAKFTAGKLNPDAAPSRDTAPAGAMDAILIMPSMEMADTKPAPQLVGDRT